MKTQSPNNIGIFQEQRLRISGWSNTLALIAPEAKTSEVLRPQRTMFQPVFNDNTSTPGNAGDPEKPTLCEVALLSSGEAGRR